MPRLLRLALSGAFLVLLSPASRVGTALAQPEPSIRTTCDGLAAALTTLPSDDGQAITIQVTGKLIATSTSAGIVFMVICSPPDPQVACAAYTVEGRDPGDEITVVGAIGPERRDRILLDPCIHFAAGE